MSKIYGIFGGSHNANIAYVENGKIISCIEEERIRRIKSGNDFGAVPNNALEEIQKVTGVKLEDADYVAWCLPTPDIWRKSLPKLKNESYYRHHDCHAYGAYFNSGFVDKTLVVTYDGGGVNSLGKVFLADDTKLKQVKNLKWHHQGSLPQVWAHITEAMGWKMLKDEGKVMGMAGHGHYDERIYNYLKQIINYSKAEFIFTPPQTQYLAKYVFGEMKKLGWFDDPELRNVLAFNLQKLTEDLMIQYLTDLNRSYPEYKNLVVAGGLFANVKMNQFINELPFFNEMFVYPPMGDDGLGLGAAIMKSVELGEQKVQRFKNMFFGISYTDDRVMEDSKKYNFDVIPYTPEKAALLLNEGKIVGFFQDGFEYGPRALGARSILVRPTDRETHEMLNNRLHRHEIMPFAPIVLSEHANEVFYCDKSLYTAEFMTMCYTTREEWIERIPAVIHEVDKTARPQVVVKENNPKFYEILNEYYKISGIPVLLNTSFNGHGEPIINTPDNAFVHLDIGTIDYLVINNYIFYKKEN